VCSSRRDRTRANRKELVNDMKRTFVILVLISAIFAAYSESASDFDEGSNEESNSENHLLSFCLDRDMRFSCHGTR
jgi:hypothetical protein